ncbi:MAG TPA: TonB family protein [Permianibacter sp.]|nr:TonB family protein [Permianibacter sp.]
MMNTRRQLRVVFVVMLGLCSALPAMASVPDVTLAPNVTVQLRGIAVAQELRSDYYIGAIYLPEWSPELVLAASETVPKRMQLKVLTERLSAREFQRHWKERIALNNPRSTWQPQGDRILKFANAFRDNLQRGDLIEFDFLPGRGTTVRLNGQVLITITGDGFYPLLLSAWLGEIPPTKAFQNHLRSGVDNPGWAVLTDKLSSVAMVERPLLSVQAPEAEVPTRVASVETAKAARPVASSKPGSEKSESGKAASAKPESSKSVATKAQPAKPATSPVATATSVAGGVPTDKQAETKPVNTLAATAGTNAVNGAAPTSVIAQSEPAVPTNGAADAVPATAAVDAGTSTTAEVAQAGAALNSESSASELDEDLLLGEYKRDALRHIRKQLEYPARAWRLGLTGSGIIRARLDRSGQLLGSEIVVSTGQMILDHAMTAMLERSLPLPALPTAVRSDELELDIPVDFVK